MGESGPRPRSLAGAVEARDAGPLMPGVAPEPCSPARWPARTAHDSRPRGSVRSRAKSRDRPKMVWCFAANRPNREDPGSRLARDLTEPDVLVQPLTLSLSGFGFDGQNGGGWPGEVPDRLGVGRYGLHKPDRLVHSGSIRAVYSAIGACPSSSPRAFPRMRCRTRLLPSGSKDPF